MRNRMLALVATVGLILTTAATGCAKRTIAKVNGEDITEQQLVDELEAQQGRDMLDYLITKTLIQQEARTKKVSVSEAEAKEYVDHIAKQMEDQGQKFSDFLEQRGMTRQDVEQRYRDFYLLLGKLLMTPEELKKDFEDNRNRFDVPAEVNYSRIIVKTKDDADKVRKQLEGGDKSFADLAKEVSIDEATKDKGGVWASPVQQVAASSTPSWRNSCSTRRSSPATSASPFSRGIPRGT
jgi:foldase protein PrsA